MIHGVLMFSMLVYVWMIRLLPAQSSQPPSPGLLYALAALAVAALAAGQSIRSKRLSAAFETLRTEPNDAKGLTLWRVGVIVSDCCAEAVVLFGFVIHMLGGGNNQVAPFFAVGIAAMVFWWPKRP